MPVLAPFPANDPRAHSVAPVDECLGRGQHPDDEEEGCFQPAGDEPGPGPGGAAQDGVLNQGEGDAVRVSFSNGDRGLVGELPAELVEDGVGPELLAASKLSLGAEGPAATLRGLEVLSWD